MPTKYYPSTLQYEIADLQTPYTPFDFAPIGRPANQATINGYNTHLTKGNRWFSKR